MVMIETHDSSFTFIGNKYVYGGVHVFVSESDDILTFAENTLTDRFLAITPVSQAVIHKRRLDGGEVISTSGIHAHATRDPSRGFLFIRMEKAVTMEGFKKDIESCKRLPKLAADKHLTILVFVKRDDVPSALTFCNTTMTLLSLSGISSVVYRDQAGEAGRTSERSTSQMFS